MTPRRPAPVPAGTHDADLAAVYADPTPEGAARRQHDRDLTGGVAVAVPLATREGDEVVITSADRISIRCPWCDGGDVA